MAFSLLVCSLASMYIYARFIKSLAFDTLVLHGHLMPILAVKFGPRILACFLTLCVVMPALAAVAALVYATWITLLPGQARFLE